MDKQWIIAAQPPDIAAASSRWEVPPLVAHLLLNRGLSPRDSAAGFLEPRLKELHPPSLLPGALTAADRIAEAVRKGSQIVLYGDYDVDGTTGVAILWHVLRLAGARVSFYVPHRIEEGYGLNLEAVRRLAENGAGLVITVDCGITAVDEADALREAGVSLIITDHHKLHGTLPTADAIVHPSLTPGYPNPDLAGAGVAFKLAWAIAQRICGDDRVRPEFRDLLTEMLPLAALGTVADVVPLVGENRILAKHGLQRLGSTALPGLRALIESAGLGDGEIDGYAVGFKLAPRINAAGRMGHARLAVELLTGADQSRAREIALYLEDHNRSRQATERQITRKALETIERDGLAGDARRAIVLAGEGWHAGVIGIVAARIVDRYHRPTVIIALSDGQGQGSGRSIKHFDIAAALSSCSEHLLSFGGHPMAAGLRIESDSVGAFTEQFVGLANNRLTGDDLAQKLYLEAELTLEELTLPATEAVLGLGPFGSGNATPRFATDWLDLADEPRCVGGGKTHLQMSFRQAGARMRAIGFGLASKAEDLKEHRRCRVAFEPIINAFNGRRSVEMRVLDLQFPK